MQLNGLGCIVALSVAFTSCSDSVSQGMLVLHKMSGVRTKAASGGMDRRRKVRIPVPLLFGNNA